MVVLIGLLLKVLQDLLNYGLSLFAHFWIQFSRRFGPFLTLGLYLGHGNFQNAFLILIQFFLFFVSQNLTEFFCRIFYFLFRLFSGRLPKCVIAKLGARMLCLGFVNLDKAFSLAGSFLPVLIDLRHNWRDYSIHRPFFLRQEISLLRFLPGSCQVEILRIDRIWPKRLSILSDLTWHNTGSFIEIVIF